MTFAAATLPDVPTLNPVKAETASTVIEPVSTAILERKALELHTDRIFDNEAWVDFLKFNRKYRPEVAAATKVVYIRTECCSKPGAIPQTQLDSRIDDRVCCPHCGRWTHYEIMTTLEMEERTYVCE